MSDNIKLIQKEQSKPLLFDFVVLFLGVLAVSLAAIISKIGMEDMGAAALNFNRFWIATSAFGLWYSFKAINSNSSLPEQPVSLAVFEKPGFLAVRELVLVALTGIFLGGSLFTWALSFNYTTVARASLLHYQHPIFTTLGAWLLFGQSFNKKFLVGLVMAVLGGIAIGIEDLELIGGSLFGDAIALLSGILFSADLLAVEQLKGKLSNTAITTGVSLFAAIFTLPVALFGEDKLFPSSELGWACAIALALICQVAGHGLLYYSMKKFSSAFVGICIMLDIVISAFLAWIIFAEPLTLVDWVVFPVVILGIYLAQSGELKSDGKTETILSEIELFTQTQRPHTTEK